MANTFLTYDELTVPSGDILLTYDELTVPIDPNRHLTYDELTVPATIQHTAILSWQNWQIQELFPGLDWLTQGNTDFKPNLINYSFDYLLPNIISDVYPIGFSGVCPGFTLHLGNTGSSGQTIIELYALGILQHTEVISATGLKFQKVINLDMGFLMRPLGEFELRITQIAQGCTDLKVNAYLMTFPFEANILSYGNLIDSKKVNGLGSEYLFYDADTWFIELNQPIVSLDSVVAVNKSGNAVELVGTLGQGTFYNNQITLLPYTAESIDKLRIRILDFSGHYRTLEISPNTAPKYSVWPEYASDTISSSTYGVVNLASGGIASASSVYTGGGHTADQASDGNDVTYWRSGTSNHLPESWAYDSGLGNEQTIRRLKIKPLFLTHSCVKAFSILGSNEAAPTMLADSTTGWTTLAYFEAEDSNTWQTFDFENSVAYRHYRINIGSSYDAALETGLYGIEFYTGVDTLTSNLSVICLLDTKRYRYSFDGVNFSSWANIDIDNLLTVDFSTQNYGQLNLTLEYDNGVDILQETVSIFYISAVIDCSGLFEGPLIQINYSDIVPFKQANLYYDGILVDQYIQPILYGFSSFNLNMTTGEVESAAGTVYYNGEKFSWPGTNLAIDIDPELYDYNWRVIFGFNTNTKEFELNYFVNTSPNKPPTEVFDNFIPIWAGDFSLFFTITPFSWDFIVEYNPRVYSLYQAIGLPLDTTFNGIVTLSIFDISGRQRDFVLNTIKTKYNIWRTLEVTTATSDIILPGQIHQEATLNYIVTSDGV